MSVLSFDRGRHYPPSPIDCRSDMQFVPDSTLAAQQLHLATVGCPMSASYLSLSLGPMFSPDSVDGASLYPPACSPDPTYTNAGAIHDDPGLRRSPHATSVTSVGPITSTNLSFHDASLFSHATSPAVEPRVWRCDYPDCRSRAEYTRACDWRKHYNRHFKHLYCRVDGCPRSETAMLGTAVLNTTLAPGPRRQSLSRPVMDKGFSSKKDRARHEAMHNPGIKCDWQGPGGGGGCGRVFSRVDNMKDHVGRIHMKTQKQRFKTRQTNKTNDTCADLGQSRTTRD